MLEIREESQQPRPDTLKIDESEIFLPFTVVDQFPAEDIAQAWMEEESAIILNQNIEFKGIVGTIQIKSDPDLSRNAETPLGEVGLNATRVDNRISVIDAPCYPNVSFQINNLQEFDLLTGYCYKLYVRDEVYFIDCVGYTEEEEVKKSIDEYGCAFVYGQQTEDSNEGDVDVYFPLNLDRLKEIRMSIVRYNDNNDDDFELMPLPEAPVAVPSR